jgi:hypothetical protein
MAKTHVFLVSAVKVPNGTTVHPLDRLIRGTLREVEAKLRQEVTIEPCTAEQAHAMSDVEIEDCEQ